MTNLSFDSVGLFVKLRILYVQYIILKLITSNMFGLYSFLLRPLLENYTNELIYQKTLIKIHYRFIKNIKPYR